MLHGRDKGRDCKRLGGVHEEENAAEEQTEFRLAEEANKVLCPVVPKEQIKKHSSVRIGEWNLRKDEFCLSFEMWFWR